jgi:microcystin-dependent protein
MPAHPHVLNGFNNPPPANAGTPAPTLALARSSGGTVYKAPGNIGAMSPSAIGLAGGGGPHNNMQPYLTLNFCIALQGVYPPRT